MNYKLENGRILARCNNCEGSGMTDHHHHCEECKETGYQEHKERKLKGNAQKII